MPDRLHDPALHLDEATLNEYLDGALAGKQRAQTEVGLSSAQAEHLAACFECKERLEALRAVFAAFDGLPELELERDLPPGVLAGLAARPLLEVSAWWKLLLAFQAALGVVLLLFTWPVLSQELTTWETLRLADVTLLAATQLLARWQLQWQALESAALQSSQVFEQWLPQGVELPFSTWQVGVLLGLGLIAWLAVNGRLLSLRQPENKTGTRAYHNQTKRRSL